MELEADGHVPALADQERDVLDGVRVGDKEDHGLVFVGPLVRDAQRQPNPRTSVGLKANNETINIYV